MASPPNYTGASPPQPTSLALPRQRPSLSLPTSSAARRKASASSATSSSHPLRQTSFPPSEGLGGSGHNHHADGDSAMYSPDESVDFSDSEITSAISGPVGELETGKKRKRGEKRSRGRPPKNVGRRAGSASVVNGEDGRSTTTGGGGRGGKRGAASTVGGEGGQGGAGGSSDEEDEDEGLAAGRGGTGDAYDTERLLAMDQARKTFRNHLQPGQQERWDVYTRAKLRTADVRRLVNQTLSQSVPQNVVTVVQAYTKIFAGMLIEGAREVQGEWMAVEEKRADGEVNEVAKLMSRVGESEVVEKKEDDIKGEDPVVKKEEEEQTTINGLPKSDDTQMDEDILVDVTQTNEGAADDGGDQQEKSGNDNDEDDEDHDRVVGVRRMIQECDRGPLLADHLRESLRRYKKARHGGTVGFTGLSLEGRDVAAARMGGRRLFR